MSPICDDSLTLTQCPTSRVVLQPCTGEFVKRYRLHTKAKSNHGIAISPSNEFMVVTHSNYTVTVYSLPDGAYITKFSSGLPRVPLRISESGGPCKVCFNPITGNLLLADPANICVQEMSLFGECVRLIGHGIITQWFNAIAANMELIVVGKHQWSDSGQDHFRIMMFDTISGDFVRTFGEFGESPGRVMRMCKGVRFTPDNRSIVLVESKGDLDSECSRLSIFTVEGEFVRCVGVEEFAASEAEDVEIAGNGDIHVCDRFLRRICVFSPDGGKLLRIWGDSGNKDGEFIRPTALAMCNGQLYVLERDSNSTNKLWNSKRVQVFA